MILIGKKISKVFTWINFRDQDKHQTGFTK